MDADLVKVFPIPLIIFGGRYNMTEIAMMMMMMTMMMMTGTTSSRTSTPSRRR